MTRQELINAMDESKAVRWMHDGYICYKDKSGQYLKTFEHNNHTIGIFHRDGIGMNVNPADCYIKKG